LSNLTVIGTLAAVVIIAAYLAFLWALYTAAPGLKNDETTWTRDQWLFQGLEAIAVGVIGALVGSQIQGRATDAAKQTATTAQNANAALNQKVTASHQALIDMKQGIVAKIGEHPRTPAATLLNDKTFQAAVSQPQIDAIAGSVDKHHTDLTDVLAGIQTAIDALA
jgi:hypothetical protein